MTHSFHISNRDLKNKSPLAWNAFLKLIGSSVVGLFLAAILWHEYQLSLPQIFLIEAIFGVSMMLHMHTWTLRLTAHHGTVVAMFTGIISYILSFATLYYASTTHWVIFLYPLFTSLYAALFWTGYHSTIMQNMHNDRHFGIHLIAIESIGVIAGLIGPLVGGVVADHRGTGALYIFAILCLLISLIPLLRHQHKHIAVHYRAPTLKSCSKLLKMPRMRHIFFTFSTLGYIDFVANIVWPIILFSLLQTYTKVAIVSFFSTCLLIGVLWVIGKKNDGGAQEHTLLERWIHYSFRGQGSIWLFAGVTIIGGFISQVYFILIDSFHKITHRANNAYIMNQWYISSGQQESTQSTLDMIYFRELAIHSIKSLSCIILALIGTLSNNSLWGLILPLFGVSLLVFLLVHVLTLPHNNKEI